MKNESAPTQATSAAKAKKRDEYTVDALADIFENNDWENLYANVPVITESENNDAIWEAWAETTTQTGQQWKQYFKKVVRPQWDQDPEWKREEVRKRFEERRRKEDEDEQTEEDEEAGPSVRKEQGQRHEGSQEDDEDKQSDDVDEAGPSLTKESEQMHENSLTDVEDEKTKEAEEEEPSTPKANAAKVRATHIDNSAEDSLVQQFLKERKGKKVGDAYVFFALEKKFALWESQPSLSYSKCDDSENNVS